MLMTTNQLAASKFSVRNQSVSQYASYMQILLLTKNINYGCWKRNFVSFFKFLLLFKGFPSAQTQRQIVCVSAVFGI